MWKNSYTVPPRNNLSKTASETRLDASRPRLRAPADASELRLARIRPAFGPRLRAPADASTRENY